MCTIKVLELNPETNFTNLTANPSVSGHARVQGSWPDRKHREKDSDHHRDDAKMRPGHGPMGCGILG